jgi:hypothetical protein
VEKDIEGLAYDEKKNLGTESLANSTAKLVNGAVERVAHGLTCLAHTLEKLAHGNLKNLYAE